MDGPLLLPEQISTTYLENPGQIGFFEVHFQNDAEMTNLKIFLNGLGDVN